MNNRKIKALPSLVICKDKAERELDSLSADEKNEIISLICQRISSVMSEFYTKNRDDWMSFIKMMNT